MNELQKKKWFKVEPKDFISIGLSIIALVIAGTSAYFANLRVIDDLRVVVSDVPIPTLGMTADFLEIDRKNTFIFINAGTRAAAITDIRWNIDQTGVAAKKNEDSCEGGASIYQYEVDPFVVRAGEMVTKKVLLNAFPAFAGATSGSDQDSDYAHLALSDENQKKQSVHVHLCMQVTFTTPDIDDSTVSIYEFDTDVDRNDAGYTSYRPNIGRPPIQLLRKWGMVFWNFAPSTSPDFP